MFEVSVVSINVQGEVSIYRSIIAGKTNARTYTQEGLLFKFLAARTERVLPFSRWSKLHARVLSEPKSRLSIVKNTSGLQSTNGIKKDRANRIDYDRCCPL